MKTYYLTAFDSTGRKLLDESFEANNEEEAKKMGTTKLDKEGYTDHTHRCVSPDGRLILFHR